MNPKRVPGPNVVPTDWVRAAYVSEDTTTCSVRLHHSGSIITVNPDFVTVTIELASTGAMRRRKERSCFSDACALGRVFVDMPGERVQLDVEGECRLLQVHFSPLTLQRILCDEYDVAQGVHALRRLDGAPNAQLVPVLCRTLLGGESEQRIVIRECVASLRRSNNATRLAGLPPPTLRRVIDLIQGTSGTLTLADMAAAAELSPSHFSRQFKHETGLAPYTFVLRQRVLHAVRLLPNQAVTIEAIARTVGFAHVSHMARAFRKFHGASPAVVRTSLLP